MMKDLRVYSITSVVFCMSITGIFNETVNGQESWREVPKATPIDDMSFATLATELISNRPLQKALNIDFDSSVLLDELSKSAEFKMLRRDSVRLEFVPISQIGNKQQMLDRKQRDLIRRVLNDDQLIRLRKWAFFAMFRNHFSETLTNQYVMRFVGVEPPEWQQFIARSEKDYSKQVEALRESVVRSIVAAVPEYSKDRLAQYLGGKYFPSEIVKQDLDLQTVPFTVVSLSRGMMDYVTQCDDFKGALRLDDGQLSRIRALLEEYDFETRKLLLGGNADEKSFLLNKTHQESFYKMDGLLRADQRLALARCTATKQLEINPRVTFERKDLRSYLGFESGKDEWKEFDSVLLTQSSLLDQEVTKIYDDGGRMYNDGAGDDHD